VQGEADRALPGTRSKDWPKGQATREEVVDRHFLIEVRTEVLRQGELVSPRV